MSKQWLHTFLALGLCLGAGGCQGPSEIDQLRQENPFQNYPSQTPTKIIIVSCQIIPHQLPGDVVLSELPFWAGPSEPITDLSFSEPARLGFASSQLQRWRDNGFFVKVAPLKDLVPLTQSLQVMGGFVPYQSRNEFRSPAEVAQYPACNVDIPTSLFINNPNGSVNKHDLPQGVCYFQVNCQPRQNNPQNKILSVRISPQYYIMPAMRYEMDEFGRPQMVTNQPPMIFEDMTLSGLIPTGYFICVARQKSLRQTDKTLGDLFMERIDGANNFQLVYIFVPKLQVAERVSGVPIRTPGPTRL